MPIPTVNNIDSVNALATPHAVPIAAPHSPLSCRRDCDEGGRARVNMTSQDFDWGNDLTLRFIKHISTERALWDFNDPRYKMKQKASEAWARISSKMDIPVDILKNKKKILMASWRPLFRKKMASIKSGVDEDEVFKPMWFAYDAMERFLGSVYDIDGSLNTECSQQYEDQAAPSSPSNQSEHSDVYLSIKEENQEQTEPSTVTITPHLSRKRKMPVNYVEEQSVNYSLDPLNSSAAPSQVSKRDREEEDDCEIYAKLLARKLRKYPGRMRDRMMYKIDGLLLENPYPDEPSSPCSTCPQTPYS